MYKSIATCFALLILIFTACETDTPEPKSYDKIEVATAQSTLLHLDLSLMADDSVRAAYTPLYLAITDMAGKAVSDLEITVMPLMHMPAMVHSAPVEQPGTLDTEELYPFAVSFIMPGDDMSYWELKVTIKDVKTGVSEELTLPLQVLAPAETRVRNLIASDDSSRVFLSLVAPTLPVVGVNDFEITIHHRATMMSFPEVAGLTVEIEPEMPAMGHGSPNNIHPVYTQAGHYKGKVNFTMDGAWQVHVRLRRNGQLIGQTDFNITFQAK